MQGRVAAGIAADAEGDACGHLTDLGHAEPVSAGCLACIEENLVWVHLRLCTDCGTVGCCDDSPGRHARGHADASRHPTVRSLEPGERWAYCYPHQKGALLEGA